MDRRKWGWVRTFGAVILAGVVLAVIVIKAGLGDPRPFGSKIVTAELEQLSTTTGARSILPLDTVTMPSPPFSLKLRAALQHGNPDSAYGLLLAGATGSTAVMVSPLGTVAVTKEQRDGDHLATEAILPWQTWPHVHHDHETNEIWLDVGVDEASIRINGELLWSGPLAGDISGLALLGESFSDTAVIDFQQLELFAEPPRTSEQARP
jgi:hypothetical protein